MEIILSKLHVPASDLGSAALAVSVVLVLKVFWSVLELNTSLRALYPLLRRKKKNKSRLLIILDVLILSKWENNPSAYK